MRQQHGKSVEHTEKLPATKLANFGKSTVFHDLRLFWTLTDGVCDVWLAKYPCCCVRSKQYHSIMISYIDIRGTPSSGSANRRFLEESRFWESSGLFSPHWCLLPSDTDSSFPAFPTTCGDENHRIPTIADDSNILWTLFRIDRKGVIQVGETTQAFPTLRNFPWSRTSLEGFHYVQVW